MVLKIEWDWGLNGSHLGSNNDAQCYNVAAICQMDFCCHPVLPFVTPHKRALTKWCLEKKSNMASGLPINCIRLSPHFFSLHCIEFNSNFVSPSFPLIFSPLPPPPPPPLLLPPLPPPLSPLPILSSNFTDSFQIRNCLFRWTIELPRLNSVRCWAFFLNVCVCFSNVDNLFLQLLEFWTPSTSINGANSSCGPRRYVTLLHDCLFIRLEEKCGGRACKRRISSISFFFLC